jgi:hypothetical protein
VAPRGVPIARELICPQLNLEHIATL